MDINIITFNSVPHSAYLNPLVALKRYRTLSEDEDIIGYYGIITLPVQDASQSGVEADVESRDDLEEQFSPHEWIPGGIDK